MNDTDRRLLAVAVERARKARAEGNHPFGAVLADAAGRILLEAGNTVVTGRDCTGHAETNLARAASAAYGRDFLRTCTLYTSAEPCAMCAGAISHARIGRVVFGAEDPKGGAVVHGPKFFEQPTCHWRPQVTGGVLAEESAELLRGFFRARRKKKG